MQATVELSESEIAVLDSVSKAEAITRDELLRNVIAKFVDEHLPDPLDDAFGIWSDLAEDGVAYQQRMRAEWDRGE